MGETLEENSLIKAKAVKEFCVKNNIQKIIVADDTGLAVDSLGGRPGVHSARYAGDHAPQDKSINKLLDEMKEVEEGKRTARFECVLTAILENGEKVISKGITNGKIALKPRKYGKTYFWSDIYTRWI
ncbi:MAG: non-canonical purine NTP pyrophosphatase [Clostridia bacterium]|nr:non-canonical purine NTP pyrophosphatase [Clostridia bacterium]